MNESNLEFVANSAKEWHKIKAVVAAGRQRSAGWAVRLNAIGVINLFADSHVA